jgi:hypothetical protein
MFRCRAARSHGRRVWRRSPLDPLPASHAAADQSNLTFEQRFDYDIMCARGNHPPDDSDNRYKGGCLIYTSNNVTTARFSSTLSGTDHPELSRELRDLRIAFCKIATYPRDPAFRPKADARVTVGDEVHPQLAAFQGFDHRVFQFSLSNPAHDYHMHENVLLADHFETGIQFVEDQRFIRLWREQNDGQGHGWRSTVYVELDRHLRHPERIRWFQTVTEPSWLWGIFGNHTRVTVDVTATDLVDKSPQLPRPRTSS